MKEFKEILKELRAEKHLLQKEVADILQVHKDTYGSWERGVNEPSLEMLGSLAAFYEVSTDYLLGREDDDGIIVIRELELPNDERRLLSIYNALTADFRTAMLESARVMLELQNKVIGEAK